MLFGLSPRLITSLLSFLTIGIFWNGQQTQLTHLSHADPDLIWIDLAFLAAVAIMPFSIELLGDMGQLLHPPNDKKLTDKEMEQQLNQR